MLDNALMTKRSLQCIHEEICEENGDLERWPITCERRFGSKCLKVRLRRNCL